MLLLKKKESKSYRKCCPRKKYCIEKYAYKFTKKNYGKI